MAKKPAPKKSVKKVVKPAAKKPAAKKVTKPAAKKVVAKKAVAKKPAPKKVVKPIAKKVTKPTAKKVVAKKTTPKKVAVKKVVAKKAVRPVAKKIVPKKIVKVVKPAAKKVVVEKPVKKSAQHKAEEKAAKAVAKAEAKKIAKISKKQEKLLKKQQEAAAQRIIDLPMPELKLPLMKKTGTQPLKRSTVDNSRTRYSDKELNEFKDLIEDKMQKSKEELHYIQGQITKTGENSTADTENRFGGMEDGAGTLEREYLNQMATRLGTYIGHLEKAMMRIENKTYGICRVTGKLISKERLLAVPHATLSLEAKELQK